MPTLKEYELQALLSIQHIGAIPLVIIHGPNDPNALVADRHAIALIQRVFGEDTVYVELGNEADLAGVISELCHGSYGMTCDKFVKLPCPSSAALRQR
jgi:hypothetical protein